MSACDQAVKNVSFRSSASDMISTRSIVQVERSLVCQCILCVYYVIISPRRPLRLLSPVRDHEEIISSKMFRKIN
jgi:hypothetical protein